MPDLTQIQPGDSHSKWSKVGARLNQTQDSTFDRRELGAQVTPPRLAEAPECGGEGVLFHVILRAVFGKRPQLALLFEKSSGGVSIR
jgi:hypothetical protein